MATILDASVMGDLRCEPDSPAGTIIVITNNVTPDRDFNIRIVASNFRESAEKTDEISKLAFFKILNLLYPNNSLLIFITKFLVMYIDTSDVSDLTAMSSTASQLVFSLTFVQETRALGVFISILFRENGLTNFARSFFFIINRATAAATNQLAPLPMGNYLSQAYDLDANGEISIEQPADQEMVIVTGPSNPGSKSLSQTHNVYATNKTLLLYNMCDISTNAGVPGSYYQLFFQPDSRWQCSDCYVFI